jgi:hypothetical protein
MRKFDREAVYSNCAVLLDGQPVKAMMINFSRMGVMITTTMQLKPKRFISLVYRNEKNEFLQILTYVAHCSRSDRYFVAGLQFIGLEGRSG